MKINEGFLAQMREATRILQTSGPMAATEAIQRALHGASASHSDAQQQDWSAYLPQPPSMKDVNPPASGEDATPHTGADVLTRLRKLAKAKWKGMSVQQPIQDVDVDLAGKGRFLDGSFSNSAGTRAYKVYVPSAYRADAEQALPLVVMLHGCKQHPADFAAGTDMNAVAEENGCFVLYPGQAQSANGSHCWNWFKPEDQQRDGGEASIIAGMTQDIIRQYRIDADRVYIAGLSAGGAMAAVMAATYPDLYAAAGIHSGVPYGVAQDLPSAFASMKKGKVKIKMHGLQTKSPKPFAHVMPAIVFHGDSDGTVDPGNGDEVLAQCVPQSGGAAAACSGPTLKVEKSSVPNGHTYTRSMRHDEQGRVLAEHWVVHGAGHAWSGGSRNGSYTDPKGPDASREMMRFFRTHARKVAPKT